MSLIHDIQAAAITQSTDVPTLLRMCKLLAARISHQQLAEWVDRELNGYPSIAQLPDYRIVAVDSYGAFVGSFSRADRLQIPVSVLPESLQEHYQHAYMGAGISAYTALVAGDTTGRIQEAWPIGLAVHHASKIVRDMQCVAAWKEIPIGAVVRLLDSVKTRVLSFAIDLERAAPDSGELPIGSRPPLSNDKMTQIFNTTITGNVGNVANAGADFSQSAVVVQQGNWVSLEKRLLELGVEPADLDAMRPEFEQAAASNDLAEKARVAESWASRLSKKALAGVAGVATEVLSSGIAKAIAIFFGFPAP